MDPCCQTGCASRLPCALHLNEPLQLLRPGGLPLLLTTVCQQYRSAGAVND
jgi:hypothetical protein